jgi:D-alanyl-D-alanine carboxypeptidase/D-alanyl-D-alanine-endopeptidase (penicillin-binding protein 4)
MSGPVTFLRHQCIAFLAVSLLAGTAGAPARAEEPGPPPAGAQAVLSPTVVVGGSAPIPTTQGLRRQLRDLLQSAAIGSATVLVVDPGSNTALLERKSTAVRTPASTLKLLTAASALTLLGTERRLATRVVQDGAAITLIGGGDATLVRGKSDNPLWRENASLRKLARAVAEQLGPEPIRLQYDDSLFTGPALAPGWSRSFPADGVVAPVTALMVDGGRVRPNALSRVRDPAREAAVVFANLLRAEGVQVRGIRQAVAGSDAVEIARVESAPIVTLVQRMITESDNDLAEALARLAGAEAGFGASFQGGAQAATQVARDLGLTTDQLQVVDGSGLSSQNALLATTLTDLLTMVATGADLRLGPIASGLAVAGGTGTLADRYRDRAARPGAGLVRAKTGTLTSVVALAGSVRDRDGRVLIFAFLAEKVPAIEAARRTVDTMAARLAECGCA